MLGLISTKLPCANEVKVLWKSGADCPYLCFLTARFGLSRVTLGISILRWFRSRFRKAKSAAGELPFPSFRGRACLNLWPTAHGKDHELCRWVYSSSVIDRLAAGAHRSYVPTTIRAVGWRSHRFLLAGEVDDGGLGAAFQVSLLPQKKRQSGRRLKPVISQPLVVSGMPVTFVRRQGPVV